MLTLVVSITIRARSLRMTCKWVPIKDESCLVGEDMNDAATWKEGGDVLIHVYAQKLEQCDNVNSIMPEYSRKKIHFTSQASRLQSGILLHYHITLSSLHRSIIYPHLSIRKVQAQIRTPCQYWLQKKKQHQAKNQASWRKGRRSLLPLMLPQNENSRTRRRSYLFLISANRLRQPYHQCPRRLFSQRREWTEIGLCMHMRSGSMHGYKGHDWWRQGRLYYCV